jgi:hypothetical protein
MARPDLAQEVNAASWGGGLLLLFGGAAYLVGGAAVGARRKGERVPSLKAHPHYGRFREVHSLCVDGAAFARGGFKKVKFTGLTHTWVNFKGL